MQNFMSHAEIQILLKSLNFERYDYIDEKQFAQLEKVLSKLPREVAYNILSGAFFYAEITKQNVAEFTLNKIINILETIDSKTLLNFDKALNSFKRSGMSEKTFVNISKQIYSYVLANAEDENENLLNLSINFVESASKVSSTFSNMKIELKAELVSTIYDNCIKRMKTFWQRVDANNFKDVIYSLTTELEEDNFTEQELVELSNRCATIFAESSRDKILGLESVLSEYKDFCLNEIENSVELNTIDIDKLRDFKVSSVLRTTASIAKTNTRTLYHTSKFLQGKSVGDIFASKIQNNELHSDLYEKYKDVKLDLSVNDMVWVLTKNPTIFSTSLTNTLNFVEKVEKAVIQSYGEKANSFDFKKLITRENFLKGIPTNVDEGNIFKNIELLSCLMKPNDLQDYLKSDMNIFNIESDKLQEAIVEVFVSEKNSNDIYSKLNDILKCKIKDKIKENNTTKKQNKATTSDVLGGVNKNETLNVKLDIQGIKDFAFDFDLKKIKSLLGKYYADFVKTIKSSGVNSEKLQELIKDDEIQMNDEKLSTLKLDADKLQHSAHTGYSVATNKIEALWQLERNISSAINLINLMKSKGEISEEGYYILSSNYLKLSGEKSQLFENLDSIDASYKMTAEYMRGKVDRHFTELTNMYSEVMKNNRPYIDRIISKLTKQTEGLNIQIQKYEFLNIDEDLTLDFVDMRKTLMQKLSLKKQEYEENQDLFLKTKGKIREKKLEIQEERENPSTVENEKVNRASLFELVYVSKREEELVIELEKMMNDRVNIEYRANQILKELNDLQDRLIDIDSKLKASAIYMGLNQRLKELNSRLNQIKIVKDAINDESEK